MTFESIYNYYHNELKIPISFTLKQMDVSISMDIEGEDELKEIEKISNETNKKIAEGKQRIAEEAEKAEKAEKAKKAEEAKKAKEANPKVIVGIAGKQCQSPEAIEFFR